MRIIGYARLSRASEASTSLERQRQLIEATCSSRGWELVGIEEDAEASATKRRLDRPGLSAVRARLAAHEADAVLVWRLDRIARSVIDFGLLLDEGLHIVSATEPLDTTSSMGRAMAEILQVFAAMEARAIGARVSASRRHLPTVGRFPGGPAAYGYTPVPHPSGIGRALALDPVEAPIVRRIVDDVLAGASLYAVAHALTSEGIPSRRGGTWNGATIRRMLRGDALLGRVLSGGQLVRDPLGLPVVLWPPIITTGEADRLRALLTATPTPGRAAASARGRLKASRLLSGVLMCSGCGSPLTARHNARTDLPAMYACSSRNRGRLCPAPVSGNALKAEAEVERLFLAAVGALDVVEVVESAHEDAHVAEVEAAIAQTTDELRSPDADLPALVARLTTLRTERQRLAALPLIPTRSIVPTGQKVAAQWAAADYLGRRRLLLDSGAEVVLAPARARGHWDAGRVSVEFPEDYLAGEDLGY